MSEQIKGGERLLISSGGTGSDIKLSDLVTYAKANLGGAVVANNATVAVVNSASGDSHNATASVTGQTLNNVALTSTVALVDNADAVPILNSAGATVGSSGAAVVAAGVQTAVSLVATNAMAVNAVKLVIPVSGTFVNGITLTVANGVITAGVLS